MTLMSLAAEQHVTTEYGTGLTSGPLFDLAEANRVFSNAAPLDIIKRALDVADHPIISTSFSEHSPVLLHMAQIVRPGITVVWCDTGFNTAATYKFVDQLVKLLDLNLQVYQPLVSAAHLQARYNGIPEVGTAEHEDFTRTVKLEPFSRAFDELRPDLWITGIRREETDFRKTQDIFTWDASRAVTKVAPTFLSKTRDLAAYIEKHHLPSEYDYFDPTKPAEHLECGLHF